MTEIDKLQYALQQFAGITPEEFALSIPYWKYKSRNTPAEKPPKLKIPLKNRLSISAFYAPELGETRVVL